MALPRMYHTMLDRNHESNLTALVSILSGKIKSLQLSTVLPLVPLKVKSSSASAGDIRDLGLVPGSERSPVGQHGKLLQYSCLENPIDRRVWQATVHRVRKTQTQLK